MRYSDLEKYYLCGIGAYNEITDYRVGTYNESRDSFSFSNGSYSNMELYKEPMGGNATYIVSAISLQELDDKELLPQPQEVEERER